VADSAIVVGVAILMLEIFLTDGADERELPAESNSGETSA